MKKTETTLPNVCILEPRVFEDSRGFFCETFRHETMKSLGIDCTFVQDNHSRSGKHALRGLHYQLKHPQAKLCWAVRGSVLDVAVDIRRGSPTFGRYASVMLSAENHRQVFIPAGFAHGFVVLSDSVDFLYKCGDYYHAEDDHGIAWNDPTIGIEWGVADPVLSKKDAALPFLADLPPESLPVYRT